ncbi:UNKNOWN [Stylonychia lemnae]|uniref:Uncharacterized protein n=1 Tax=Stylonychia lemnae TaxID=5949 RepID=A0A078A4K6_STYLE|nr:UNKNOWN [Stylonychia lemnae]|eukprot:CDW76824.1 UNKNOWN [Stylonychia lemnae]
MQNQGLNQSQNQKLEKPNISFRKQAKEFIRSLDAFGIPKDLDFAIKLEYLFMGRDPDIQQNLDQYVYLQLSQNIYTWVSPDQGPSVFQKQKIKTELIPCAKDSSLVNNHKKAADFLKLNQTFLCPEQCKSPEEIRSVASLLRLHFVIENSFFDDKSFDESAVKKQLKPYYFSSAQDKSLYYYMLLSQNEIVRKDNMVYGNDIREKFVETKIDYHIVSELNSTDSYNNNAYISIYVQMDEEVKRIERRVFNLLEALRNTGGFMTVSIIIAYILVRKVQECHYYNTLIKNLYNYQSLKLKEYQLRKKTIIGRNMDIDEEPKADKRIISHILDREQLKYNVKKNFTAFLRRFGLCRTSDSQSYYEDYLYQNGLKKIYHELDIRNISNELRTLKFLTHTILDKQQRYMLPFFKSYLLNTKPKELIQDINFKKLNKSLSYIEVLAIFNEGKEKTFQRILKNIQLEEKEYNDEKNDEIKSQRPTCMGKKPKANNQPQENNENIAQKQQSNAIATNTANEGQPITKVKNLQIKSDLFQNIDLSRLQARSHSAYPQNYESFSHVQTSQRQFNHDINFSSQEIDFEEIDLEIEGPKRQIDGTNFKNKNNEQEDDDKQIFPALDLIKQNQQK